MTADTTDNDADPDPLAATTFRATDQDTRDERPVNDTATTADAIVSYTLEGADAKHFSIGNDVSTAATFGVLTINDTGDNAHMPNYEKQSSYSITIVATSGTGDRRLAGRLDVTIKVTNAEDAGSVELSQIQPREGQVVTAMLTDEDGSINIQSWKWQYAPITGAQVCNPGTGETGPADAAWTDIPKATVQSSYTPKDFVASGATVDIAANCLRATATYTDGIANAVTPNTEPDTAMEESDVVVQVAGATNAAPVFPDQDLTTLGDQSDETSRSVAENTAAKQNIGSAVAAGDGDGDLLLYTLGGADADSFGIDRKSGQIMTKAKLDYETKDAYMVTVTATDPSGAADSIVVNISVTDEDDNAAIQLNAAPEFADDSADRSVDENSEAGTAVGDPVAATDPNGDALSYELGGDDAMSFAIDGMGQITVAEGAMLDHEAEQNTYVVTVTASDGIETASITVNIAVADVKENNAPAFASESMTLTVPENSAGINIGDPVAATDPDEGDELEYSITDESGNFAIDSATGQVSVMEGAMLDHEAQASYMVVVMASDGEDSASVNVTISVTNVGLDNPYDTDDSGSISKAEAVNAVQDYFDDALSRDEVLEVIRIYFG